MMKTKMRLFSILLCIVMIFTMQSVRVQADSERIPVSDIRATSSDIDSRPVYGNRCLPPYNLVITQGEGVRFAVAMGSWEKKNGDTWEAVRDSEIFTAGTWRYRHQIRIDGEYGSSHVIADDFTFKMNDESWSTSTPRVETSYSYAQVYSPEIIIPEPEELMFYDSDTFDIGVTYKDIAITEFSVADSAEGGTRPYIFSKTSGPAWIVVSEDGTISGTPTVVGNNDALVVRVTDSEGQYKEITIAVGVTADDAADRIPVSALEATCTYDKIAYYTGRTYYPEFTVTLGNPVRVSWSHWERKSGDSWTQISNTWDRFTPGTYRVVAQLRLDGDAGVTHVLKAPVTFKVNGMDWSVSSSATVTDTYSYISVSSEEIVITDTSTPQYFTVTFDSKGGSSVAPITDLVFLATVDKPTDPTYEGYTFFGWYKDEALTQPFVFSGKVNSDDIKEDITLYAKWVANDKVIDQFDFTITAPADGENPSYTLVSAEPSKYTAVVNKWHLYEDPYPELTATDTFEEGKLYALRYTIIPAEGYYCSPAVTGNSFTVNGQAMYARYRTDWDIEVHLTALAAPEKYTVAFDAGEGTGTMADVTGVRGEYTLPANGFTSPSGKQFKAWSVGGSEKAVGDKIDVTANTTVTAVWEEVSEYTKLGDISAVEATASIAPELGAKTNAISFTITEPADSAAKGVKLSVGSWYKKDASAYNGWAQCSNGVDTFEEGIYRLKVQLRTDKNADKEYYAISGDTTFTVSDVPWSVSDSFKDYYATDGYGWIHFASPEFTLGGKTLDSIAVTTSPTKTVYREGEDFSPDGMVVTATYTDSTTAPILLYTVTDGTDMAAGKTSVTISYTEGGVTKTTTQAISVAKEYTVMVEGGTGNGKYIAGEEVSISAFVSTGMQFKEWQGTDGLTFTSGNKNSQVATFTMPAENVNITAVTGPAEYYVSVTGGSGTGMYEAGEMVTIVADTPEAGKQFKEWFVGDGKVLRFTESDITSSTAKFVMPGEAVRIEATYEDIPTVGYIISFAANGGTGTMTDVTGVSGEYTLPACDFTAPDGKQFKSWSVGGSEKAVGEKITVAANITVTAVWEDIPVPTATPVPTAAPTATPEPTVAPTATPEPTVAPTATPEPTVAPTATPIPTATPEPTVVPTATPEPTVAPTAVPTATPEPTVAPTATPIPTATPKPTVAPTATPVATEIPISAGASTAVETPVYVSEQSPKTSDNSTVELWLVLWIVSGFGGIATFIIKRRRG